MIDKGKEDGYALITMLILVALLMALLLTHFSLTWIEMATTRSSMNSFLGFYAAEAGLNIRADHVRGRFAGFSLPTGESPDLDAHDPPCEGGNEGSGDFQCIEYKFQDRKITTYVRETVTSTNPIVIPRGENFKNLYGHEWHYVVYGNAESPTGMPEAVLEMHFKSRRVPVFQFSAFYDKDLEILPSTATVLQGPVHTNGDLYLGSTGGLDILGQVTATGDIYRGRKDSDTCMAGSVEVSDPDNLAELPTCSGARAAVPQSSVEAWNGMIDSEVSPLTIPTPHQFDPGEHAWDLADMRVVLDITGTPEIQVRNVDGSIETGASSVLNVCGAVTHNTSVYNHRETATLNMLDVDLQALFDCAHMGGLMSVALDDVTDGGLVWYFTVFGAESAGINDYAVRVSNGSKLGSTSVTAPPVTGLTLVTDQAMYLQGNYNTVNKKPAAIIGDTINVLSNNWDDANSAGALAGRVATATTIQAGFLASTDTTGGMEGVAGQDSGSYNGGLSNFIRLHEDWSGVTLSYSGSFVSLSQPRHADGALVVGAPQFSPPVRAWSFDTDFEDPLLMPPASPIFVYLKQELFVRQFEL